VCVCVCIITRTACVCDSYVRARVRFARVFTLRESLRYKRKSLREAEQYRYGYAFRHIVAIARFTGDKTDDSTLVRLAAASRESKETERLTVRPSSTRSLFYRHHWNSSPMERLTNSRLFFCSSSFLSKRIFDRTCLWHSNFRTVLKKYLFL